MPNQPHRPIPTHVQTTWPPTPQLEFSQGIAGPAVDRAVQDLITDAFKGVKGISFEPNRNFSLEIPTPNPLTEPDDMVIVEPPCHPNEPLKVPEEATARLYCLVCGLHFAT